VHLLEKFVREERVRVPCPEENLQLKITRTLERGNEFVSYIDDIGELDGQRCLIDWKTTTSRYSDEPQGLLSQADFVFTVLFTLHHFGSHVWMNFESESCQCHC
jgi:hypothetical protein